MKQVNLCKNNAKCYCSIHVIIAHSSNQLIQNLIYFLPSLFIPGRLLLASIRYDVGATLTVALNKVKLAVLLHF